MHPYLTHLCPAYSIKYVWPKFQFYFNRDHQKNFLWASRLWVGRQKEPILSYVTKNDEKKNPGTNGLIWYSFIIFFSMYKLKWIQFSEPIKRKYIRRNQRILLKWIKYIEWIIEWFKFEVKNTFKRENIFNF